MVDRTRCNLKLASLLFGLAVRVEQAKKKLLEAGAVSPETAKAAKELGLEERIVTSRLAKRKGITATADGKYYVEATT